MGEKELERIVYEIQNKRKITPSHLFGHESKDYMIEYLIETIRIYEGIKYGLEKKD